MEDQQPGSYQVSVKGVVVRDGLVLLLHNERQEWELPGGRLELQETPPECVAREIAEETGWVVSTGPILDASEGAVSAKHGAWTAGQHAGRAG